jgi:hypothetical protein
MTLPIAHPHILSTIHWMTLKTSNKNTRQGLLNHLSDLANHFNADLQACAENADQRLNPQ